MADQKLRMLALGFLPPPIGGVAISFEIFCNIIAKRDDVHLSVINLSGVRQNGRLLRDSLALVRRIWREASNADVVTLYCPTPQVPTLGLATWLLCRLRGKPIILRKAAGTDHIELGPVKGRLAEFVAKHVDLYLAQTKSLVEACRKRGIERVGWYPTSRPAGTPIGERDHCRRFVFVGHVRPAKGLKELIAASERMPDTVSIDVYGPFFDGMSESDFAGRPRIVYKGVLPPEKVLDTIRQYDAFVLPSKHLPEGYPGAIIEALSVGLPIITTTVGGIPEIVDERCGVFVEMGNVDALVQAMNRLASDNSVYHQLCSGALEVRSRFSAEYWADWMVKQCNLLRLEKGKA